MEAKVGITVFFSYDGYEYEREIENITIYKNYSWFGDLGYGCNVAFVIHGDLDCFNHPIMEGLAIQFDDLENAFVHGYIRCGIRYEA